jgi:hypothetical protein
VAATKVLATLELPELIQVQLTKAEGPIVLAYREKPPGGHPGPSESGGQILVWAPHPPQLYQNQRRVLGV